jgi:hypothetical protein
MLAWLAWLIGAAVKFSPGINTYQAHTPNLDFLAIETLKANSKLHCKVIYAVSYSCCGMHDLDLHHDHSEDSIAYQGRLPGERNLNRQQN